MTKLLIGIKRRCPRLWRAVERVNGRLFALRYPHFDAAVQAVLAESTCGEFSFAPVAEEELGELSALLTRQPAERMTWFAPHGFDGTTLERLWRNRAFAMMKIADADRQIVGYFFLRCFFVGRAFHGLLADARYAHRGLGRAMWALSARICAASGLQMLATVSPANGASLASARQATEVTVLEELADGYLLIECKPRPTND